MDNNYIQFKNKIEQEQLVPNPSIPVLDQKIDIGQMVPESTKKTIRRSGLEIRKAEELEEKKRIAQEKEWEIPAFLRKVKFKN